MFGGSWNYLGLCKAVVHAEEGEEMIAISLKRRTLKMLVHGKKGLAVLKSFPKNESNV